jgi:3-isopropylmalate/(R)-2-methylmalate dehydratase small subunit
MQPFTNVTALVAPVAIKDVDTDMIIPANFLTSISRAGFGAHVFSRLKASYTTFYLNQPRYNGAQILVADSNFGCGSSREHAVWALTDSGIKVIIGKSFADIFSNNSGKNGLLLVTLPAAVINTLLTEATDGTLKLTVDLEKQSVNASDGRAWHFEYDPFLKHCLLNGLDELEYLRSQLPAITEKKELQRETTFFDSRHPHR